MLLPALLALSSIAATVDFSQLPPWPGGKGMAGPAAGISDDHLIVAGGANFPHAPLWETDKVWHDDIWVLELPDGGWSKLETTLPEPLAYAVSITHPKQGLIIAGGDDGEQASAGVMRLALQDGVLTVSHLPDMPAARTAAAGTLIGDTLWIFGGQSEIGAETAQQSLWSLNLKKEDAQWKVHQPLPGAGRILPVVGASTGQLFVFSGASLTEGKRTYLQDVWAFNPSNNQWAQLDDMPRPAVAAPSPAPLLGHDMLLIIGGDDGSQAGQANTLKDDHPGFSDELLSYCTTTGIWRGEGTFPRSNTGTPGDPATSVWPTVTVPVVPWQGEWILPMGEMRPRVRSLQTHRLSVEMPSGMLATLDWIAIALYLLALLIMGIYFAGREKGTDDFFLGGRRVPWWAAGISIFATQLSAITFVSIPAKAYSTDWVYFIQSLGIFLMAPVVAYLFLPFYRRLRLTTAYEFLERRFGVSVRLLGSAQFILSQTGRVAVVVFLPALALAAVTGIDIILCISLMGLLSIVYTVMGGIEVVIWSDVLQTIVLIGGAIVAAGVMLTGIPGGWDGFIQEASQAGKFDLIHPGWSIAEPVLYVVLLGSIFNNIIPYTSDQAVVQRYLTTPDESAARRAIWTGGILAIPASVLFFGLGTLLWAFYRSNPGDLEPLAGIDQILPWFVVNELPAGVSGLIIAAVFAAAMSSIDSSMNSVSTAFTTDFYRRFKPGMNDEQALRLARWVTAIFGIVGTAAAILIASLDVKSVLDLWFKVLGLFASGLCGLFFLGIFTKRPGTAAAIAGLVVSALVNLVVGAFTDINGLMIAGIGIAACVGTGVVVGLWWPSTKDLTGLTLMSMPPRPVSKAS
ncbi:MAG: sodium/solute symporter [Phycisphaerales bacterium]|nr:sodium/solute symporter [Phycisphaerales bacterium]